MGKKFGLPEARALSLQEGVHFPTVKATLKVLGVANVVGKEVAKLVADAHRAIQATGEDKNILRTQDAEDERMVAERIRYVRTVRDGRAKANAAAVAGYDKTISDHRAVIADLKALAEKFS